MLSIDLKKFGLPAAEIAYKVNEALSSCDSIIITAPPGAGKSTLLPLTMLSTLSSGKKILMLEPRRIAARQIATRMADMIDEEVGQQVGYRIRFENAVSTNTRIEVLTEGILTRMLQADNELSDVGIVIFDEFHERSLFTDIALALCRECQQILRPDLKIVIMSATIDTTELSTKLNAPVIESQGRMFPVETIHFGDSNASSIATDVSRAIRDAHEKHQGDILAFLPGEAEIRKCEDLLSQAFPSTSVYPLYGMLSQAQQKAAILPDADGKRKIVLATSIAETSLTIEGISIVVDSGYCRQQKFNPNTGLSHLETVRISADMADQRRGRAGRLTNGFCYRLWSKASEQNMSAHRTPEIEYADLSQLVLDLAAWGESNADNLLWLSTPPRTSILQAQELLRLLNAIDDNGQITEHGRQINKLPCHPRIAQMLLSAKSDTEKSLASDIAAILEERDPLSRESGTDINLRIEALRRFRAGSNNNKAFSHIEKTASKYRQLIKTNLSNDIVDCYATGALVASAYPERIATSHVGNNATFRLANGTLASTEYTDTLSNENWLSIANLDAHNGMGKIYLASPLDPSCLCHFIRERDNVQWDSRKGCIIAQHEKLIGKLVISTQPLHNVNREEIDKAILNAIKKEGLSILNWDDDVKSLQNRILSVSAWHPEKQWPDVTTEHLMQTADEWLQPYIGKATSIADLKKIDLSEAIKYTIDYDMLQELEQLAPTRISVPSGSRIKLEYQGNGEPPVLAVRLQECFGLADTPTIDNGRKQVLMHLLSPGFKPVQITQDLKSFWDNTYFEVKKELKRRYPKHVWPEKPWEEPATKSTKNAVR